MQNCQGLDHRMKRCKGEPTRANYGLTLNNLGERSWNLGTFSHLLHQLLRPVEVPISFNIWEISKIRIGSYCTMSGARFTTLERPSSIIATFNAIVSQFSQKSSLNNHTPNSNIDESKPNLTLKTPK